MRRLHTYVRTYFHYHHSRNTLCRSDTQLALLDMNGVTIQDLANTFFTHFLDFIAGRMAGAGCHHLHTSLTIGDETTNSIRLLPNIVLCQINKHFIQVMQQTCQWVHYFMVAPTDHFSFY